MIRLLIPVIALAVSAASAIPDVAPYRVSAIRAQLFYNDRGTFSDDVLADSTIMLFNTIIGEGDAEGPSNSTLVVLEISGPAGDYDPQRTVELTATAGPRVLLRRTQKVGILNVDGHAYVGFMIYDTGCYPVWLSARINGQPSSPPRTARIAFNCGE